MNGSEGADVGTAARTLDLEGFLARSGAGASSLRTYRKLLTRCEVLLGGPLADASQRSLGDLKDKLRAMRSGPLYIRRLKAFYKAAGRDDLAEICVLKQRLAALTPDDILTLPEVKTLIQSASSLRDRALIAALWGTGQRVGAVCALKLGDLTRNGHGFAVQFRHVKVKGEEHQGFILDDDGGTFIAAWLAAYPPPSTPGSPLFPSYRHVPDGNAPALTPHGALSVVKDTAQRAGMKKRVYSHLFRHSKATHNLRLGMTMPQIKKLQGWKASSPIPEARYSHLADKDAYAALLKANGIVAEEATVPENLTISEGELRAVVPMAAPPGQAPMVHGIFYTGIPEEEIEPAARALNMLAADPAFMEEMMALIERRMKVGT